MEHIEHTHCSAEQQTCTRGLSFVPNITISVGGYSTLATQPYLSKVSYPTKYIILTFSFQENDEYAGACRRKKTHGRQSLALPDTVYSQEREQPYFSINSGLLVGTQSSSRPCILSRYTGRERGGANAYVCSILLHSNGHLSSKMTAGRTRPVLTLYAF